GVNRMPGLENLTRLSQGATHAGARLSGARPMLPSFLIVGGKRCGSTSFYEYVVRHPSVVASRGKKGTHYFDVNFPRGLGWYLSKFPSQPRRNSDRSAHLIT